MLIVLCVLRQPLLSLLLLLLLLLLYSVKISDTDVIVL